jgi:hypothetical protein
MSLSCTGDQAETAGHVNNGAGENETVEERENEDRPAREWMG